MANFKKFVYLLFMHGLCFSVRSLFAFDGDGKKAYIIYMGSKSDKYSLSQDDHLDILKQATSTSTSKEALIRSYGKSFNGFSAKLTEEESKNLKSIKGVVSVFPSRTLETQTTRAWDFLGLPKPTPQQQGLESDIIVGVFDSGIWSELPSFYDDGFGPPPKKWKGVCKGGWNFTCNKKLIGARTYFADARDYTGHGTHSASIIAGREVANTNFYGIANGLARGGVPSSRIAIYKVCDTSKCSEDAILAAFDDAINDGVDMITVSIGAAFATLNQDVVSIGAFHAMEKGILTLQAAGNSRVVGSVAPWIFSVAASTMDRHIVTKLVLGNGKIILGTSINSFTMAMDKYSLVHPVVNVSISPIPVWNEIPVKGKILVLDNTRYIDYFMGIEAAGIVCITNDDVAYIVPGPVIMLAPSDYATVMSYLNDSSNPEGLILRSETIIDISAPVVASFSSRGPNPVAPDILKPDITAPGVDILAAFSPAANLTKSSSDKRRIDHSFLTGTSISCPVVAGAAAYVKSQHPDWSPAAIKSALMTTASPMGRSKNKEGEFAYGAGHLNPTAALNPGLVYEITRDEYMIFMCKLNYTENEINQMATGNGKKFSCPKSSSWKYTPNEVNYPAMLMQLRVLDIQKPFTIGFQRVVTNVGVAKSTYVSKIESEGNIDVTVDPTSLSFSSLKEQKSFVVTVSSQGLEDFALYSASIVWSDGIHSVRSPIGVYS